MRTLRALLAATLLFSPLLAGCGGDSVAPANSPPSVQVEGRIGPDDFEIAFPLANGNAGPLEGPFVLRGTALHYDSLAQALTVDLTITNRGVVSHPEPIGLTFVRLMPPGVTVLNPDNDVHGDGAGIVFGFANDDAVWTPGETSFPRTVQFAVAPGVAVGFVGRIDIGAPVRGGSISGRVWNDMNRDGIMDDREPGIGGVPVTLRSISGPPDVEPTVWFTRTQADGHYRFGGLRAGTYVVSRAPVEACMPTTPTEITVLLTATGDEVTDFTGANFGCVPVIGPPPIVVGAYVEVQGKYLPDPHRVIARNVRVMLCGDCREGKLRGPVTAIGVREHDFAVMGTWVVRDSSIADIKVTEGQRLDVRVRRGANVLPPLVTDILKWDADHEEVHGRVDSVVIDRDGTMLVRVFDTLIVIEKDVLVRP